MEVIYKHNVSGEVRGADRGLSGDRQQHRADGRRFQGQGQEGVPELGRALVGFQEGSTLLGLDLNC